ncbi:hypothetical protein J132_08145 [Termitomyces sp. J132]|nr:hypothetical protein H2248_002033 [Termitomyces sp. 'cryptogamus']KNZ78920.1 hypothetical protein J132_08145 [Termitomyces sp. J132]
MRATELFAIFAFIKSLERIYLTPGFTPYFVSSGVVSVPSLPPALLNIISYDFFGTPLEVPALSTVAPVNISTIVSAPTCIVYISQIARPRFSPAPVIPPRPQPVCLNLHLHPKFEAPGPKSLWNIPSPFPSHSKSLLPNSPFCLPTDEPEIESEIEIEIEDENESIWLSLLLSPTVLAAVWNFCRLLVHRPIRNSTAQPGPVDSQGVYPLQWSQLNPVIPRRNVEYKDRVTQSRIFISALPSLSAGSDTSIIIPQRHAECNSSPTASVPISPPPRTTETSLPSPPRTPTTSSYTLSPLSSTEPSLDEPVVQPASSHPPTPTPSAASVPPPVFEGSQSGLESSCWAPTPESVTVESSDAPELSWSLPTCGDTITTSASSLPTPTPTPVKKKRVRTRGPKHLRVPKTALPTVEIATQESSSQTITTIETLSNSLSDSIRAPKAAETALENDNLPITPTDVSNVEVQDSDVLLTETAVKTPSKPTSSLSDSVWASKLSEATPEKNVAPIFASPPSEEGVSSGVQDSMWAVAPDVPPSSTPLTIETPSEASSSLSDSIWTPATEDVVSPVTSPPRKDKASGLHNSIWATTPEAPKVLKVVAPAAFSAPVSNASESSSSQLVSENTSKASTALSTPPPVKKRVRTRGLKHLRIQSSATPIAEVSLPTTVVAEASSEASSSLSGLIWAPKPSRTNPDNILVVSPLGEERASGLKDSIWATACDGSEVVVHLATLPTPPSSAKRVSSLEATIWADDTPTVAALSAPVPICEEDLLACEQRNEFVSASRWANAPDTPSTPRRSVGRGGANRWKGRRGRASSRA